MAVIDMPRLPFVLDLFDATSDVMANMPAQLQGLLQQNFLEKAYQEYAEPNNAYAALAETETFAEQIGTTLTKTRPGLKAPIQLVTDAATSIDDGVLNNGVIPSEAAMEQYTLTPATYEDGSDLDLIAMNYSIVPRFGQAVKTNIIQAVQSRDLLARNTLLEGYIVGTTKFSAGATLGAGGGGSTNGTPQTIAVPDIRGFRTTVLNGKITPVGNTATTQLLATVYPNGLATNSYQVYVIAATADSTNVTNLNFVGSPAPIGGNSAAATRCNGISGTLQIVSPPAGAGATITNADIIVANDAPKQFLGGTGKLLWSQLTSADLLTQSMILDARAWLDDQGMEPLDDGTYLMVGSNRSFRSLYGDADFKQAFQGLGQSPFFKKGRVDSYLGVTFLTSTNAPKIALPSNAGFAHVPMMIGKGALIDAWFEGMQTWAESNFNDAMVDLNEGIAQVLTPPIDRMRRKMKLSWLTIRDMTAPTDVTVNSNIILTAGGGRRKRAVLLPHGAGS